MCSVSLLSRNNKLKARLNRVSNFNQNLSRFVHLLAILKPLTTFMEMAMKKTIYENLKTSINGSPSNLFIRYVLHVHIDTDPSGASLATINIHNEKCQKEQGSTSVRGISPLQENGRFWVGPFHGMFNAFEACLVIENILSESIKKIQIKCIHSLSNPCVSVADKNNFDVLYDKISKLKSTID